MRVHAGAQGRTEGRGSLPRKHTSGEVILLESLVYRFRAILAIHRVMSLAGLVGSRKSPDDVVEEANIDATFRGISR